MTQTSNILKYPEKMNNVSSVLCLLCHMFSSPLSLKNQSLGDSLKTEVIGKHPLNIPVLAPRIFKRKNSFISSFSLNKLTPILYCKTMKIFSCTHGSRLESNIVVALCSLDQDDHNDPHHHHLHQVSGPSGVSLF